MRTSDESCLYEKEGVEETRRTRERKDGGGGGGGRKQNVGERDTERKVRKSRKREEGCSQRRHNVLQTRTPLLHCTHTTKKMEDKKHQQLHLRVVWSGTSTYLHPDFQTL